MKVERTVLGLGDIGGGGVIITNTDCYLVSSLKTKIISLKSGTMFDVENRDISRTITSFGEHILELVRNDELVIRWER